MEFMGIAGVAAVTVICWLFCEIAKAIGLGEKWCPVIAGVCGAAVGAVAYIVMPDYPAGDYITAIAVGISSGLAATGADQIFKQLTKDE